MTVAPENGVRLRAPPCFEVADQASYNTAVMSRGFLEVFATTPLGRRRDVFSLSI